MANEAVLKYLTDTNRPYSCADVTVNLRGAFSKGVIQKTLDGLSEARTIKCKLYGKQKVYAAIQPDNVEGDSDIEDFDTQFKTLQQTLNEKSSTLRTSENNLKNLISAPKTSSAKQQIEEINARIITMEEKLGILKNSTEVISADVKTKILSEHDKYFREYRKRKRICTDMLEAMMEGNPKSKKDFIDELCIETDDMVEFKLMSTTQ